MKVLIELFDTEQIYNYLAALVFKPEKVYFVGDNEIMGGNCRRKTEKLAKMTGIGTNFLYKFANPDNFPLLRSKIAEIIEDEKKLGNECFIDVTGGRDLALVAAGFLMSLGAEIIRYDPKSKVFRVLSSGETHPADISLSCEELLTVAGGTIYSNTHTLPDSEKEKDIIRKIIRLYFEKRNVWTKFVKYLQRVSKKEGEKVGDRLLIEAPISLSADSKILSSDKEIMNELKKAGAITHLEFSRSENKVEFKYASSAIANLLVNEGVWLELIVYLIVKNIDEFNDWDTGVKFIWDIPDGGSSLTALLSDNTPRNEVDVMAVRGIKPLFISCKTRAPINEDLNELYAIREHFGGEHARAALATTKYVGRETPIYERARAMGIEIIDERDFECNAAANKIKKFCEG
ncbi:MAG: DUF1887 family protein [Clostridia bacterium]|nr:DUF1887 family protein [Clostridia bacterium]